MWVIVDSNVWQVGRKLLCVHLILGQKSIGYARMDVKKTENSLNPYLQPNGFKYMYIDMYWARPGMHGKSIYFGIEFDMQQ